MTMTATLKRGGGIRQRTSGSKLVLEQTDYWLIESDAKIESKIDCMTATGLPNVRTSTLYGFMQCVGVDVTIDEKNSRFAHAQVTYNDEITEDSTTQEQLPANPVEWTPFAEVEFEPYPEVMQQDINNKPFVNAAKDPFATGIEIPKRLAVRVFSQFEAVGVYAPAWAGNTAYKYGQYVTNNGNIYRCMTAGTSAASGGPSGTGAGITDGSILPAIWNYVPPPPNGAVNINQIMARCDKVNSTAFLGCAAKTLLLEVRKAAVGTYYGYSVWRIDYALKYKPETWTLKMANVGYMYNTGNAAPGEKAPFLKKDPATQTMVPFLGKLAANGTALANQATGTMTFEDFEVYGAIDFNNFLRISN